MFKKTYASLVLACSVLAVTSVAAEEEKVLNVYNWNDYIEPSVIPEFEKETGIKVIYDVFDSNEVLEAKLLAGKSGYDIVVPGSNYLAAQIKAGAFMKLDKEKLPNLQNMDPVQMKILATVDPDNQYAIPYSSGTTGIAYNKEMIAKRLGADYQLDSWDVIFKPEYLSKLKDCGVAVLDAPTEVMATAMNYLGLDPHEANPKAYKPAEELLEKMSENVTYFHSSKNINDLANGEICITLGWSGDLFQAADRAREAKNGIDIAYIVPKEGGLIFYDMMAIPADAEHKDNAHRFINFLMRPDIMAKISSHTSYASANKAAMPLVIAKVRDNPNIYLSEEMMKKMFIQAVLPPKTLRSITKSWNKIRTGHH